MNEKICSIYTSKLFESKRKKITDSIISKDKEELNITFCENDTLEKFETDLSILRGSSFIYFFKKNVRVISRILYLDINLSRHAVTSVL